MFIIPVLSIYKWQPAHFFFKTDVNPNLIKMFYALEGGIFNIGIHREKDVHNCHEVEKEVEWMLNTFLFQSDEKQTTQRFIENKM